MSLLYIVLQNTGNIGIRYKPFNWRSVFQPSRFWPGWNIVHFLVTAGDVIVFPLVFGFVGQSPGPTAAVFESL